MDVTPLPNQPLTTQPAASTTISSSGGIEADFDTFLSLLTAQLENQDPLKPVDSTEFVAQLAEFSAVEQQVQSNSSLADILETLQGGDISALADWLGAQVSTDGSAQFAGQALTLSLTPPPGADTAVLVVRDENGVEAARLNVPPTTTQLSWSGENDLGGAPPHGRYRFSLEASAGGEPLATTEAEAFVPVLEARMIEGTPQLTLANGDVVNISDVVAVRQPET